MNYQGSKITPRRSHRFIRAMHGLVVLYSLAMFFLNAAPAFSENMLLTRKEFWISLTLALPFLVSSGIAFVALATDTFPGTSLCSCVFSLLVCILLLPDAGSTVFFWFMLGLIVLYGTSVLIFFRALHGRWTEQVAMYSYAHKTSFLKYKRR